MASGLLHCSPWLLLITCSCQPALEQGEQGESGGDSTISPLAIQPGPARLCPAGMVGVPPEEPVFCLDAFEASLDPSGVLASVEGALPLVNIDFQEALALCASTPVLGGGASTGYKRLATLQEWRDGADGVLGDGGLDYPYGDDWEDGACAVPNADGSVDLDDLAPTGSFPDCTSPFGAYDLLGNAWEWADPELDLDLQGFLDDRAAEGLHLQVTAHDSLEVLAGDLEGLEIQVAGLTAGLAAVDGVVMAADPYYQVDSEFRYRGFLVAPGARNEEDGRWLLPVEVEHRESATAASIEVLVEEDGAPVAAKVGCAWYSGSPAGCRSDQWHGTHLHDFAGTIGIRCAADPIPDLRQIM